MAADGCVNLWDYLHVCLGDLSVYHVFVISMWLCDRKLAASVASFTYNGVGLALQGRLHDERVCCHRKRYAPLGMLGSAAEEQWQYHGMH